MISLVLKPRHANADGVEFHPSHVGKRMFPYRDGHLVAFWRTLDEARRSVGREPILVALMTIFDVAFWPMERVHADLHGKPLMKIELTSLRLRVPGENATSEQAVPFDLVYALSPEETKAITEGAAASAGQTPT